MTDRDELVRRLRDKDQIVIGGLFYCIPVMREAASALSAQQPVAWIAFKGDKVHHFSVADGWSVEEVATVPASPPPAPVSAEAVELAKLMLLPRYTDQDGKKVAAALLRVAEGAQKQGPTEEEVKLAQRIADSRGEFADMMVASTAGLLLARAVLRLAHK